MSCIYFLIAPFFLLSILFAPAVAAQSSPFQMPGSFQLPGAGNIGGGDQEQTVLPPPITSMPVQDPNAPGFRRQPRVRFCYQNDMRGFWKLRRVFETPEGVMAGDFKEFSHQYFYFEGNGIRYDLKSKQEHVDRGKLLQAMKDSKGDDLQQFVVNDSGGLYFYTNRELAGSYYCGIAEESGGPYLQGDMILTPAEGQGGSLFTVWQRPVFGQQINTPPLGQPAPFRFPGAGAPYPGQGGGALNP